MKHSKHLVAFTLLVAGCLVGCATSPAPLQVAQVNSPDANIKPKSNITFVNNTTRTKTNAKGEPLICKEFKKTGTRLQTVTQCNTKAEWDNLKKQAQDNIKNMYLKLGSDHG